MQRRRGGRCPERPGRRPPRPGSPAARTGPWRARRATGPSARTARRPAPQRSVRRGKRQGPARTSRSGAAGGGDSRAEVDVGARVRAEPQRLPAARHGLLQLPCGRPRLGARASLRRLRLRQPRLTRDAKRPGSGRAARLLRAGRRAHGSVTAKSGLPKSNTRARAAREALQVKTGRRRQRAAGCPWRPFRHQRDGHWGCGQQRGACASPDRYKARAASACAS